MYYSAVKKRGELQIVRRPARLSLPTSELSAAHVHALRRIAEEEARRYVDEWWGTTVPHPFTYEPDQRGLTIRKIVDDLETGFRRKLLDQ